MTDIEHELRELFEEKTRDARTMPGAPPEVLKRGRRRQVGTVAIGATTALLVAVASIAVLRAEGPGRATTPGSNDLGERTATIQNFTVTAPSGWTLIDWGPSTAAGISVTQATPQPSTTSAGTTLVYAHPSPVFELANIDPGLDERSACSPSGPVRGSTDAAMVIERGDLVWNTGATETPQPWPVPVDPTLNRIGPCGEGNYTAFELNGTPYFAFLRVSTGASETDRQLLFDAYAGMQARIAPSATTAFASPGAIGYVLAAGVEQGVPWRLELGPRIEFPTLTAVNTPKTACLRVLTANDRGFGCTPLSEASTAAGLGPTGQLVVDRIFVDGPVLPDAAAVELQTPGQDPVEATIVAVPDSIRSSVASLSGGGDIPARLYWMLVDRSAASTAPSRVVQLAADGSQLSSQPIVLTILGSSSATVAQVNLRNALVAAKTYYTDGASYVGFTPSVADGIEPSLTYNTSSAAVAGEVSIRDVTATTMLLVTAGQDGSVWCVADDQDGGTTTYGTVDAQTTAECVGGDAAWAIVPAFPSPTSTPSPSSSLHPIETGTALGVTWTLLASLERQQYCVEFDAGTTGSGVCSAPATAAGTPAGPSADAPAQVTTVPVAAGEFLIESVPSSVSRIDVAATSGETFTGVCVDPHLIPALMTRGIRFCVVPLAGSDSGTIHFLAADGSEPFPSQTIHWSNQASTTVSGSSGSTGP